MATRFIPRAPFRRPLGPVGWNPKKTHKIEAASCILWLSEFRNAKKGILEKAFPTHSLSRKRTIKTKTKAKNKSPKPIADLTDPRVAKALIAAFRKRWSDVRRWARPETINRIKGNFEAALEKDRAILAKSFYGKAHIDAMCVLSDEKIVRNLLALCRHLDLDNLSKRELAAAAEDLLAGEYIRFDCDFLVFEESECKPIYEINLDSDDHSNYSIWNVARYSPAECGYDDWYERVGGFNTHYLGVLMKSTGEPFSIRERRMLTESVVRNVMGALPGDETCKIEVTPAARKNQMVIFIKVEDKVENPEPFSDDMTDQPGAKAVIAAFRKRWSDVRRWARPDTINRIKGNFEAALKKDQAILAKSFYGKAHIDAMCVLSDIQIVRNLLVLCQSEIPKRELTALLAGEYVLFECNDPNVIDEYECSTPRRGMYLQYVEVGVWCVATYPADVRYNEHWYEAVAQLYPYYLGVLMKSTGEPFSIRERRMLTESVVGKVMQNSSETWTIEVTPSASNLQMSIFIQAAVRQDT